MLIYQRVSSRLEMTVDCIPINRWYWSSARKTLLWSGHRHHRYKAVVQSAERVPEMGATESMGDLQDPKMEVTYHILGHILWGYSLKFRLYIGLIYGRHLQFRYLKWPLNWRENTGGDLKIYIDGHDLAYGNWPVRYWTWSIYSWFS